MRYIMNIMVNNFADTLDNVWEFTLALENLFPQQKVQQQDNTRWNQCHAFTTSLRISRIKCIPKVFDSSFLHKQNLLSFLDTNISYEEKNKTFGIPTMMFQL